MSQVRGFHSCAGIYSVCGANSCNFTKELYISAKEPYISI